MSISPYPPRSPSQLRDDAQAIWQAAVAAVRSDRLVRDVVQVAEKVLHVGDHEFTLNEIERIVVVGAGKAGAGMACGLEEALGPELLFEKRVNGWVNVPADCVRATACITLFPARPAGKNEPTTEGVAGTRRILSLVQSLGPRDLCIGLFSGGGSALLPAPIEGISLHDKQQVTRFLSAAGANIRELNAVRQQLSLVKGGRLAQACRAGTFVSLIISDVLGDPLEIIASGPTVKSKITTADALLVLRRFDPLRQHVPSSIYQALETGGEHSSQETNCLVINEVIGNLAVAVDAAGMEAERRGYSHAMLVAREMEGAAENIGTHLADLAMRMREQPGPDCLITGGEPTVTLVPAEWRGKGGRNQQLVLAALHQWQATGKTGQGIVLLSGGTDGEDGPTDAAGAMIDADTATIVSALHIESGEYLQRNNAYNFFVACGGLMKTGPTHTNVCDVRVVVVDRVEQVRK